MMLSREPACKEHKIRQWWWGELGMEVPEHWEGVSVAEICSPGSRLARGDDPPCLRWTP